MSEKLSIVCPVCSSSSSSMKNDLDQAWKEHLEALARKLAGQKTLDQLLMDENDEEKPSLLGD